MKKCINLHEAVCTVICADAVIAGRIRIHCPVEEWKCQWDKDRKQKSLLVFFCCINKSSRYEKWQTKSCDRFLKYIYRRYKGVSGRAIVIESAYKHLDTRGFKSTREHRTELQRVQITCCECNKLEKEEALFVFDTIFGPFWAFIVKWQLKEWPQVGNEPWPAEYATFASAAVLASCDARTAGHSCSTDRSTFHLQVPAQTLRQLSLTLRPLIVLFIIF